MKTFFLIAVRQSNQWNKDAIATKSNKRIHYKQACSMFGKKRVRVIPITSQSDFAVNTALQSIK